jgi:hypothetical protein
MPDETENLWEQSGWATYAAIMLFGSGLVGIVNGIWAIRYNDVEANLVVLETNLTFWGVVALLGGIALLAAGIGVFYGRRWARWTGIWLAVLTVVWSVGWAQVQPTQSLILALIHITVIYALAAYPVTVERGS